MLTATDFLEDSERAQIYSIAPGERNGPLSLFRDTYSEELAYPGICLGQKDLKVIRDRLMFITVIFANQN